jgi:hypothetical protein
MTEPIIPETPETPEEIQTAREGTDPVDPETAALLSDEDEVAEIDDELLASILGQASKSQFIPETQEEIEARAAEVQKIREYNVESNVEQIQVQIAAQKKSLEDLLKTLNTHLNAEFNQAIYLNDSEAQNALVTSEAPRWYQLAAQDFQTAFMKLERSLTHPQGL